MEKIRVAVVGYGHIAREAVKAVNAARDMEMTGIVIRDPEKADRIFRENGLPVALDPGELENLTWPSLQ